MSGFSTKILKYSTIIISFLMVTGFVIGQESFLHDTQDDFVGDNINDINAIGVSAQTENPVLSDMLFTGWMYPEEYGNKFTDLEVTETDEPKIFYDWENLNDETTVLDRTAENNHADLNEAGSFTSGVFTGETINFNGNQWASTFTSLEGDEIMITGWMQVDTTEGDQGIVDYADQVTFTSAEPSADGVVNNGEWQHFTYYRTANEVNFYLDGNHLISTSQDIGDATTITYNSASSGDQILLEFWSDRDDTVTFGAADSSGSLPLYGRLDQTLVFEEGVNNNLQETHDKFRLRPLVENIIEWQSYDVDPLSDTIHDWNELEVSPSGLDEGEMTVVALAVDGNGNVQDQVVDTLTEDAVGTVDISNLENSEQIAYVLAFEMNEVNYPIAGIEVDSVEVTYSNVDENLQVFTDTPTNVLATEATLNGQITEFEGFTTDNVDVWFEWRLVGDTTWQETSVQTIDGSQDFPTFDETITGLQPSTDYEYRANAEKNTLSDTGSIETFSTVEEDIQFNLFQPENNEIFTYPDSDTDTDVFFEFEVGSNTETDVNLVLDGANIFSGTHSGDGTGETFTHTETLSQGNYEWYVEAGSEVSETRNFEVQEVEEGVSFDNFLPADGSSFDIDEDIEISVDINAQFEGTESVDVEGLFDNNIELQGTHPADGSTQSYNFTVSRSTEDDYNYFFEVLDSGVQVGSTDVRTLTVEEDPEFSGGDGTQENPFIIADCQDFIDTRTLNRFDDGMVYLEQYQDIDCGNHVFDSLPSDEPEFNYKGNGYTVSNFVVEEDETVEKAGVYNFLDSPDETPVFENIGFENVTVVNKGGSTGLLTANGGNPDTNFKDISFENIEFKAEQSGQGFAGVLNADDGGSQPDDVEGFELRNVEVENLDRFALLSVGYSSHLSEALFYNINAEGDTTVSTTVVPSQYQVSETVYRDINIEGEGYINALVHGGSQTGATVENVKMQNISVESNDFQYFTDAGVLQSIIVDGDELRDITEQVDYGDVYGEAGTVEADDVGVTILERDEMRGTDADNNMPGLDWNPIWETTFAYPTLVNVDEPEPDIEASINVFRPTPTLAQKHLIHPIEYEVEIDAPITNGDVLIDINFPEETARNNIGNPQINVETQRNIDLRDNVAIFGEVSLARSLDLDVFEKSQLRSGEYEMIVRVFEDFDENNELDTKVHKFEIEGKEFSLLSNLDKPEQGESFNITEGGSRSLLFSGTSRTQVASDTTAEHRIMYNVFNPITAVKVENVENFKETLLEGESSITLTRQGIESLEVVAWVEAENQDGDIVVGDFNTFNLNVIDSVNRFVRGLTGFFSNVWESLLDNLGETGQYFLAAILVLLMGGIGWRMGGMAGSAAGGLLAGMISVSTGLLDAWIVLVLVVLVAVVKAGQIGRMVDR